MWRLCECLDNIIVFMLEHFCLFFFTFVYFVHILTAICLFIRKVPTVYQPITFLIWFNALPIVTQKALTTMIIWWNETYFCKSTLSINFQISQGLYLLFYMWTFHASINWNAYPLTVWSCQQARIALSVCIIQSWYLHAFPLCWFVFGQAGGVHLWSQAYRTLLLFGVLAW